MARPVLSFRQLVWSKNKKINRKDVFDEIGEFFAGHDYTNYTAEEIGEMFDSILEDFYVIPKEVLNQTLTDWSYDEQIYEVKGE